MPSKVANSIRGMRLTYREAPLPNRDLYFPISLLCVNKFSKGSKVTVSLSEKKIAHTTLKLTLENGFYNAYAERHCYSMTLSFAHGW